MKENTWCARLSILRQILMFRSTNRKFKTGNDSITNHSRYFVQFRISSDILITTILYIEIYKLNISCVNSFIKYKIAYRQEYSLLSITTIIQNIQNNRIPNNLFPRLDRKFNHLQPNFRLIILLSDQLGESSLHSFCFYAKFLRETAGYATPSR